MFKCIQKIKAEQYNYDPDIGWNTRKKIIEYYKNYKPHAPKDSYANNDWMYWAQNNFHHVLKPDKSSRIEYNNLLHSRTIRP